MTLLYGQTDTGELVPLRCDDSGRILTVLTPDPTGITQADWLESSGPGPIGIRYKDGKAIALSANGDLALPVPLVLKNGAATVLSLSAAGDLVVPGNIEFGAVGKVVQGQTAKIGNILFSTPAPSTNPKALDDYEEGSFAPRLFSSVGPTEISLTGTFGRYTVVGNTVYAAVRFIVSALNSAAGELYVDGLPIASLASTTVSISSTPAQWSAFSAAANTCGVFGTLIPNTSRTQVRLFRISAAAGQTQRTPLLASDLLVNSAISFNITYLSN